MQVRLLRVLEAGRFSRIGADQEIATDVRVIAASNRDLRVAVAAGKLREDLMYRLCVIPVSVPPLRERGGDALLLAEMFLDRLNEENGTAKTLSAEARQRIASYRWPGNVRELKNVIHRAYVMSDDEVEVDTGGDITATVAPAAAPRRSLDGSKSKAAQVLGISLKTLYNRLHAYGGATRAPLDALPDETGDVRLAA